MARLILSSVRGARSAQGRQDTFHGWCLAASKDSQRLIRLQPFLEIRRQNVSVSVNNASPEKAKLSSERFAASGCPAPHASVMTTGIKPRSAAWRTVGSIPTSIAMPATATAIMAQSRKAKASGVPSKADMASLSNMASLGSVWSSGTMAKPGVSRRNHGRTFSGSSTRCHDKEINSEFCKIQRSAPNLRAWTRANPMACKEIPYSAEQRIFVQEHGICAREQRI